MKLNGRDPWPALTAGQLWRMNNDINCLIGVVGKRLVHYKLFKGKPVRVPSTLGNKEALTAHLRAKRAVLVQEQTIAGSK